MVTATVRALAGLLHDLTDDDLLVLTDSDNRPSLKKFLDERVRLMRCMVSYDQSTGLLPLIRRAVGKDNLGNIDPDITKKRFPLCGTGIRSVRCHVEPYLNGENVARAFQRLTGDGYTLANTGDLAGFLHDHPEKVAKWMSVHAISNGSQWSRDGHILVPRVYADGVTRDFGLVGFLRPLGPECGVLVIDK